MMSVASVAQCLKYEQFLNFEDVLSKEKKTIRSREALVRSAWIIKTGEDFPRLVSCYVLRGAV